MLEKIEELHAILGFGHHLDIFPGGQGSFYSGAEKSVVISNGYFNYCVRVEIFHGILIESKTNKYLFLLLLLRCKLEKSC